jgi:hypothetical protein
MLAELRSLRAQAYVILGSGHLWAENVPNLEKVESVAWLAAQHLVECYQRSKRPGWPWFESRMTYANAVLPHALFVAARRWPKEAFLEVARESFTFLQAQTTSAEMFWPVGNFGWYSHGEAKAEYDQQPVEAVTMADAALAGFELTGDEHDLTTLRRAHAWFHGRNSIGRRSPIRDRRLLRRPATDRRQSEPGRGVDAGVLMDRSAPERGRRAQSGRRDSAPTPRPGHGPKDARPEVPSHAS